MTEYEVRPCRECDGRGTRWNGTCHRCKGRKVTKQRIAAKPADEPQEIGDENDPVYAWLLS